MCKFEVLWNSGRNRTRKPDLWTYCDGHRIPRFSALNDPRGILKSTGLENRIRAPWASAYFHIYLHLWLKAHSNYTQGPFLAPLIESASCIIPGKFKTVDKTWIAERRRSLNETLHALCKKCTKQNVKTWDAHRHLSRPADDEREEVSEQI